MTLIGRKIAGAGDTESVSLIRGATPNYVKFPVILLKCSPPTSLLSFSALDSRTQLWMGALALSLTRLAAQTVTISASDTM